MTNHDVDQRATPAMLTFNVDSADFVQCLSLSSTHNVDYTYIPKTIKPDSFQPGLGHTGNVFFVKIASKTIKPDSFQPCLGHTGKVLSKLQAKRSKLTPFNLVQVILAVRGGYG